MTDDAPEPDPMLILRATDAHHACGCTFIADSGTLHLCEQHRCQRCGANGWDGVKLGDNPWCDECCAEMGIES